MKIKLNNKLIISYLLISTLIISTIAILINITFKNTFKKYVINAQLNKNKKIAMQLTKEYDKGHWDEEVLEKIGIAALEDGIIIKIKDKSGEIIWDAMEHNSGMCVEMLAEMAKNMEKYHADSSGEYEEMEYQLTIDEKRIGIVTIGYYGPYYYSENDIMYITTFNRIILIVVILSVIVSIITGIIMASKLTYSLKKIILATQNIANSNYKKRVVETSNVKEFLELSESVNYLATKLDSEKALRDKLTTDVAHELRTPIAILESHLEALKDGIWEIDEYRINNLYDETKRLSEILTNLDNLNYYESNNIELKIIEFKLKDLINNQVDNLHKSISDKNIVINVIGDEFKVRADKNKIISVLLNLISNSIKYSNEGGEIEIEILKCKDVFKIIISDDGIGISREHLLHIFERFYRVDNSRTRETGGSGIGLSIVKSIVSAHNGTINIESEIGVGTRVEIEIPLKIN